MFRNKSEKIKLDQVVIVNNDTLQLLGRVGRDGVDLIDLAQSDPAAAKIIFEQLLIHFNRRSAKNVARFWTLYAFGMQVPNMHAPVIEYLRAEYLKPESKLSRFWNLFSRAGNLYADNDDLRKAFLYSHTSLTEDARVENAKAVLNSELPFFAATKGGKSKFSYIKDFVKYYPTLVNWDMFKIIANSCTPKSKTQRNNFAELIVRIANALATHQTLDEDQAEELCQTVSQNVQNTDEPDFSDWTVNTIYMMLAIVYPHHRIDYSEPIFGNMRLAVIPNMKRTDGDGKKPPGCELSTKSLVALAVTDDSFSPRVMQALDAACQTLRAAHSNFSYIVAGMIDVYLCTDFSKCPDQKSVYQDMIAKNIVLSDDRAFSSRVISSPESPNLEASGNRLFDSADCNPNYRPENWRELMVALINDSVVNNGHPRVSDDTAKRIAHILLAQAVEDNDFFKLLDDIAPAMQGRKSPPLNVRRTKALVNDGQPPRELLVVISNER